MFSDPLLAKNVGCVERSMGRARLIRSPFSHVAVRDFFDPDTAESVLDWLEHNSFWTVKTRSSYLRHVDENVCEHVAGANAQLVADPRMFEVIRIHLETFFQVSLSPHDVHLSAERVLRGHRIGAHTDNPTGGMPTHRLVLNFNRGHRAGSGGRLLLMSRQASRWKCDLAYSPQQNCGIIKQFSSISWHSLEEATAGTYFSLRYAFWTCAAASQKLTAEVSTSNTLAADEFARLIEILKRSSANNLTYGDVSLISYLEQTCQLLNTWECDSDLCRAGLFHLVLGSRLRSFRGFSVGETPQALRNVIGDRAMLLIRLLSECDWETLVDIVSSRRIEEAGESVYLRLTDISALVTLVWASTLQDIRTARRADTSLDLLKYRFHDTVAYLPKSSHADIESIWQPSLG
jgi:hypothetical protein